MSKVSTKETPKLEKNWPSHERVTLNFNKGGGGVKFHPHLDPEGLTQKFLTIVQNWPFYKMIENK